MAIKNKKPFSYVFHYYFKEDQDAETFKDFKKVCIFEGKTVHEVLFPFIESYVSNNKPNIDNIDLVTENELIQELHDLGHRTTKRSLLLYRQRDILKDPSGLPWWYTDGTNIIYDKAKMIKFIEYRANNPMSRLIKESAESDNDNSISKQGKSGAATISG